MKEDLIKFETAKLAKEKGFSMLAKNFSSALVDSRNNKVQRYSFYREFNESNYTRKNYPMTEYEPRVQFEFEVGTNCNHIFGLEKSYLQPDNQYLTAHFYLAPTQSLLQKWLKDVHDIQLYVVPVGHSDFSIKYYYYQILGKDCSTGKHKINRFITYEEALEAGLIEALKLIK